MPRSAIEVWSSRRVSAVNNKGRDAVLPKNGSGGWFWVRSEHEGQCTWPPSPDTQLLRRPTSNTSLKV